MKAEDFLLTAKKFDEIEKNYPEAIKFYEAAADCFLEVRKCTPIETSKNLYRLKAMEVKNRIDQLKKAEKAAVVTERGGRDENKELENELEKAIISEKPNVFWSDVAGLEVPKESLREAIVPLSKFSVRFVYEKKPWRGILLYGVFV
jgi:vacuolar protein-sorting-associated protein 4